MKIVIAGGSGFLGTALAERWCPDHEIVILSRDAALPQGSTAVRSVYWDGRQAGAWCRELEGAGLLLNLAGKSVNCRYTKSNRAAILASRTESTAILGRAVQACASPPRVWMNSSSSTIYPHANGSPRDENFSALENDFSVQVCKAWEAAFDAAATPDTRKIILRTAIVLGRGGALPVYERLARVGLGGRHGLGNQMFSWIHVDDFGGIIEWLLARDGASGIYNIAAPHAVTNEEFMSCLRAAADAPLGLPAPEWAIRIASRVIGTEPELLLKSRWVVPARLFREGYRFKYGHVADALRDLLHQPRPAKGNRATHPGGGNTEQPLLHHSRRRS